MNHSPEGRRTIGVVVVTVLAVVAGYLGLAGIDERPGFATVPMASLLDPGFGDAGTPGVTQLDPSSGYRTVVRALPLPDGSIVLNVAATDANGLPAEPFGLARLDPNGQLDTSFGDPAAPGFVASVEATAMAVDGDGRLLLAGLGGIRRYTGAGAVDTSFVRTFPPDPANPPPPSTPGRVDVHGEVERILVGADGSIVVAGSGHPGDGYSTVTRLLVDGDYDPTFGPADDPGLVTLPFTPIVGPVELVDGRLGVAPRGPTIPIGVMPSTPSRAVMYVITRDGALDLGIGDGSGVVELGPPGIALFDLVRSGDRLLLNGWVDGAKDGLVVATDLQGVLDPSWAEAGWLEFADLGQHSATLIRWPDRVAVGLEFVSSWDAPQALVRLTDDGALDGSFGTDPLNPGWLVLDLPAPTGAGHWLTFDGAAGGAVVGSGREGWPPVGGLSSRAEVLRTVRFDGAPIPAPIRPYATPSPPMTATSTTAVVTSVPTVGVTTTTPPFRIDRGADVQVGAVRVRP